jgi:hypothetical protein
VNPLIDLEEIVSSSKDVPAGEEENTAAASRKRELVTAVYLPLLTAARKKLEAEEAARKKLEERERSRAEGQQQPQQPQQPPQQPPQAEDHIVVRELLSEFHKKRSVLTNKTKNSWAGEVKINRSNRFGLERLPKGEGGRHTYCFTTAESVYWASKDQSLKGDLKGAALTAWLRRLPRLSELPEPRQSKIRGRAATARGIKEEDFETGAKEAIDDAKAAPAPAPAAAAAPAPAPGSPPIPSLASAPAARLAAAAAAMRSSNPTIQSSTDLLTGVLQSAGQQPSSSSSSNNSNSSSSSNSSPAAERRRLLEQRTREQERQRRRRGGGTPSR